MISVPKKQLKKEERSLISRVTTQKELDFLAQISMDDSPKESLSVSLKSTERGGRIFLLIN